ncbi:hypothetical protein NMYAN_10176 [Nitrosomonas nitrosa]|uniref:Uncharacterized protein n=2 Tax=Nitrosomonas nitrosa TaxID=52442 RepID=A0A8H8YW04_9PROT|nr:hypothetical protein NMYAN_10176 [Nitrosomonas nitrosa]
MTGKGKEKGSALHPNPLPNGEGRGERGEGIGGRWRAFDYEELIKRDKISLDIFWLKDESLSDSDNLPAPYVIAQDYINIRCNTLDLPAPYVIAQEIVDGLEVVALE